MNFSTLLTIAASLTVVIAESYPVKSCKLDDLSYSCSTSSSEDTCCYENYGVILQTQFWDTDNGSDENVFTIHGLWDDKCDGSYDQYCDSSLELSNLQDMEQLISETFNKPDLYNTMSQYWLNDNGDNSELWIHEYNKHGTCFNTIQPSCFTGDYKKYENTVYFYEKVVEVWQTLPTYDFLEEALIVPSNDKTYKLSDIKQALKAKHGGEVYVGCTNGAINQIWYYFNVKGNVLNGDYKPIDSLTDDGCGEDVKYLPK